MPSLRLTKTSVDKIALTSGESVEYFDNKLTGFGVRAGKKNRTALNFSPTIKKCPLVEKPLDGSPSVKYT